VRSCCGRCDRYSLMTAVLVENMGGNLARGTCIYPDTLGHPMCRRNICRTLGKPEQLGLRKRATSTDAGTSV